MPLSCLQIPCRHGRTIHIRQWLQRGVLLVLPLLLCLMTSCGGDLPLPSLVVQADPQLLRVLPATETYDIARGWFGSWSRVLIIFTNLNSAQRHRIIIVQGDSPQIAALLAAAAQSPDYAPPVDPAVLSATPLVPPRPNGGPVTYDFSFDPPGPGQYVYLCTVPGHYQAGMWGTLTLVPH